MRLSIELQDVLQHAQPSIVDMSVSETVLALNGRDGAFMSYDGAYRDCSKMTSGLFTDALIDKQVYDKRDWVRNAIVEVAKGLNGYLSKENKKWIGVNRKPVRIFKGFYAKPSIRGIIIEQGMAAPVLIISRRSINFDLKASLPFLMRGGYEFHLRDDPNFTDFIVLDLTRGEKGKARECKAYMLSQSSMMPLRQFEEILAKYAEAATLSKYGLHIPTGMPTRDLFKM